MFKGFYNLTSGMLTQGRRLDVIANNMTNVATTGYKSEKFTASTFDEVVWSLVGNKNKQYTQLGTVSYITAPSQLYTDYTPGSFDETGMPLDFVIEGEGFFAVNTAEGRVYTRKGNFSLDEEGYLGLPDVGRVLDQDGQEIQIYTDQVQVDEYGQIFMEGGGYLGRLGVFAFEDNAQLGKGTQGLFMSDVEGEAVDVRLRQGMVERSNVDLIRQMTEMIESQRAYQSAAQVTKIYDQLMTKATTDVGRL